MINNTEKMKGQIRKGEDNQWFVVESHFGPGDVFETYHQLHPEDVNDILELSERFDNIEARILSNPEVQFEIVENQKISGIAKYAKLVHPIS